MQNHSRYEYCTDLTCVMHKYSRVCLDTCEAPTQTLTLPLLQSALHLLQSALYSALYLALRSAKVCTKLGRGGGDADNFSVCCYLDTKKSQIRP